MQNKLSYLPTRCRDVASDAYEHFIEKKQNPILAKIFASRPKEGFFESHGGLLSFKLLKGIDRAVDILENTLEQKNSIVIVADYDSDGATSCAIAMRCLKSFGAKVDFFVPNRFEHGYGLTASVVQLVFDEKKPDIILTVDNGTSSFDGVSLAHELGMKVLVTDHHLPGTHLPDAAAIVNPNQPGCSFPSKSLAGCGVIFYVMAALRERLKMKNKLPESALPMQEVLDLVAIGTIADVVKLDANNRLLAHKGLLRIREGKAHAGVAALFMVAKRNTHRATSKDIGFGIGPRINAAGRLADMSVGIRCLLEDRFDHALELALQLNDLNTERKNIEGQMQENAQEFLLNKGVQAPMGICVYEPSFHEGVIGIVAGRIKEKEHRPTIVFGPSTVAGLLKGSGRSIEKFNLKDALDYLSKKHPEVLQDDQGRMKFGGHAMAAGLTIRESQFENFAKHFEQICEELLTEEMLERFLLTDGDVSAQHLTLDLAETLSTEVWGQGFSEPLFCSTFMVKEQKLIKNAHLKLTLEKEGYEFSAIWFFKDQLLQSKSIEAVYTIEPGEYRGDVFVQIQIRQAKELEF